MPAHTRRELLRAGVAAGGIGCAVETIEAPAALARARTDADVLHHLVGIEQLVAFAYAHVISAGTLSPAVAALASHFAAHEQQHVSMFELELGRLGGRPPRPPSSVAAADKALAALHVTSSLVRLRNQREAVELLLGAEGVITGAYYVAIGRLASTALLQTAAQAMAAEAQHSTALRRVLHPRSVEKYVPNPFVQGQH